LLHACCRAYPTRTAVPSLVLTSSHRSAANSVPPPVTLSQSRWALYRLPRTEPSAPSNRCHGTRLSLAFPSTKPRCNAKDLTASIPTCPSSQALSPHGPSTSATSPSPPSSCQLVTSWSAASVVTARMAGVNGALKMSLAFPTAMATLTTVVYRAPAASAAGRARLPAVVAAAKATTRRAPTGRKLHPRLAALQAPATADRKVWLTRCIDTSTVMCTVRTGTDSEPRPNGR